MNRAELASATGLSEAMVSRLVSGQRMPSMDSMIRLRLALSWSVERQLDARFDGTYAEQLKERMERRRAAKSGA